MTVDRTALGRRFLVRTLALQVALCASVSVLPRAAGAQDSQDERASSRVLAVAEAALEAISREDAIGFTDLMIPEAVAFPVRERDGETVYGNRNRADMRDGGFSQEIAERGFDADVRVSGPVAVVWLPYDLYLDGQWSHCGVDVFTMIETGGEWRIAAMAWSVLQPPDCDPHPDGPP